MLREECIFRGKLRVCCDEWRGGNATLVSEVPTNTVLRCTTCIAMRSGAYQLLMIVWKVPAFHTRVSAFIPRLLHFVGAHLAVLMLFPTVA